MKLLLLLTGLSATAAITLEPVSLDDGFAFTENALPPDVLASLQAKIKGGAVGVEASSALAEIFGVTAGAFVPGKVAAGPVAEHQDRFADGGAVTRVNVMYLDVGGVKGPKLPKFTLRDMRTGVERSMQLKPNLLVSYENEFFTHRVDADESSKRFMLGPTSLHKDGVLARVGGWDCPDAEPFGAPEGWRRYDCPDEHGNKAWRSPELKACCGTEGDACPGGSECVPGVSDYTETDDDKIQQRRSLTFGFYEAEPLQIGCCYCPDGREWNNEEKICCKEGEVNCFCPEVGCGCVLPEECCETYKGTQVLCPEE